MKGGETMRFFQNLPNQNRTGSSDSSFRTGAIVKNILVVCCVLLVIGFLGWKLFSFVMQVRSAWNEISFAYNNPSIVKAVRVRYESQKSQLDSQFINQTQSPEVQAIQQVQKAVESSLK